MPHPFLSLGFNSWSQKFSRGSAGVSAAAAFLEYITTSSTSSFTLLSTGTVDYEVDWGDGTTQSYTTNNPTHTYSSAGEYTIKVTPAEGSIYRPYFNNAVSDTSIASVSGTGGSQLGGALNDAWEGASNMTSFSSNIDTSSVTNFSNAWNNCFGLTSFPLINTSNVTSFYRAWFNCSSLTSFPLIDTSSGTSFNGTWYNCSSLTSFPLIDTSSGLSFYDAWNNCNSLTSFPLLDTSNVTSFYRAWRSCSSLTSFPLIDTSSGTSFSNTWRDCSSLTSFPLIDTSSGTSMSHSWRGCSSLTSFPLINTSNVTTFSGAWQTCSSLASFPLLDTSSGTSFNNTWNSTALTSFPSCDFSSATNFNGAWYFCSSLTSFPANMFDTTGTLLSTAFANTWKYNALTAQSIENILVSLDTNGASNITLNIDGGTNAAKTTWSTAANTAYNNLITKGWSITYNA